jgi:hypothetical protein
MLNESNSSKTPTKERRGKNDSSVSAEKLSIIKLRKFINKTTIIIVNIHVIIVVELYPSPISIIENGMTAKSGKKLKNDSADLPKT